MEDLESYDQQSREQIARQDEEQQVDAAALPAGVSLEEAVRRGLIYPPPPSFYQSMSDVVERPPLPPARQPAGPRYPYRADAQTLPPPDAPPAPGTAASPPVQKRSRKWIWIVASILGVALVVSCGLCGWAFYNIFNTSFQTTTGVISTVDDYYNAIQSQNYALAYKDLTPQGAISGLTQQGFIQQAQQRDQQYGKVTSYTFGQPSFTTNPTTGPDLTHITMTVNVARNHLNYVVILSLSNTGGSWKITDFNRI